ncbi:MAG: ATP-binding protein [Cyanobacteriota bacterium]
MKDNEEERINKLYSLRILDTLHEKSFDDITYIASIIFDVPISLISFIDKDREWFKSKIGLYLDETKKSDSFCQYTIMGDDVFVIEDTHENELFKNNRFVVNSPNIRFYAGAPLKTKDGFKLGALCIIDKKPKKITEEQKKVLTVLADKVMLEISFRELLKNYLIEVEKVKKMKDIADVEISKLNSLICSTDNIIFLIDKEKKLSAFNNAFKVYFKKLFNTEPFIGIDIINNEFSKSKEKKLFWEKNIKRAFLGNKFTKEIENRIEDKLFFYEITFNPVFFNKEIIGVSIFVIDITTKKIEKKELEKAKELAEKATLEKSIFIATMSHEIRNPLNGVVSTINLMENIDLNPETKKYLDILKSSSEVLLSIVNDILDFSKINSGKMILENESFNIRACIKNVYDVLFYKIKENKSIIEYEVDKDIPEFLNGDIVKLRQILINLTSNSSKFTHNGKINIKVSKISNDDDKIKLKFEVSDTGIGIAKDKIDLIFNPYEQADSSIVKKYGGTGLGLSISKQLLEIMGSSIYLTSEENVGTTFYFELSFNIPNQEKIMKVTLNSISEDLIFRSIPLKILIAEDNLVNQTLFSSVLKKLSYEPDIANNGIEAINLFKANKYDIIFMDLQMPLMNGYEASRQILSLGSPVIIAVSGTDSQEEQDKCFEIGLKDFVIKPFTLDIIRKMLLKWLTRIKMKKEDENF